VKTTRLTTRTSQLYHGYDWYIGYLRLPMEITIDIDNPVPPFEQLIEQIKAAVTAGVLKPGEALPSIRQLANDLELNSKTVAKAYKLLERDSIIEAKGYRGTYIHPKAKSNCKFNLQEWTLRKLGEVIAELREAGVTDSEIRNAFASAISRQPPANVR
jgi:GntR family transcriptional regulator